MKTLNQTATLATDDRSENFNTDELIAMLIGSTVEAQGEFRKQVLELAKIKRLQGATAGGRVVRSATFFPFAA